MIKPHPLLYDFAFAMTLATHSTFPIVKHEGGKC